MIMDKDTTRSLRKEEHTLQHKIFVAKVEILYGGLLLGVLTNFICASLVLITFNLDNQNDKIQGWYIAVLMVSMIRLILYLFYKYKPGQNSIYFELYIFCILVSGLLWGVCAFYLMPIDRPIVQMVVIVLMAGITSGIVQALQVSFISSLLYVAVSIFPLCVWLFLQKNTHYLPLAIAMTTFIFFTIISSYRGCKLLKKTLLLTFKNDELIEDLSLANNQLATLNEQTNHMVTDLLQREIDLQTIGKMSDFLQSCKVSNEAYIIIGNSAKTLFQHLSGGLVVFDKSTQQLKTMIQWGTEQILKENFSIDDCWAVRQGHLYLVEDPGNSLICYHFETQPEGAYLCLPQVDSTGVMGMFFLCAPEKMGISLNQQQLALNLNEVIKLSLSNIYLHELLNEQTIRDPLTHLYNRRFLDELLPRELLRVIRQKQSLCVSMIDIDYFKQFNDVNGHEAGDEVLKFVGQVLRKHFRGNDVAARFGGEEFILISVDTDIIQMLPRLAKIREEIKAHKIQFHGQQLPQITISVGVAEAPRQYATMSDIIQAADEAMYSAKHNGRDRIEVF